jgi:hypothetical protein
MASQLRVGAPATQKDHRSPDACAQAWYADAYTRLNSSRDQLLG